MNLALPGYAVSPSEVGLNTVKSRLQIEWVPVCVNAVLPSI